MTTDVGTEAGSVDAQQAGTEGQEPNFSTVDEAKAEIKRLAEEHQKVLRNLEQSRKEEKFSKAERKRLEDEVSKLSKSEALTELQQKYEAEAERAKTLETRFRNRLIDEALTGALKDAKAKSIPTVLKLINRDELVVKDDAVDTKSIETVIAKLRQEDSILFEEVQTPEVKRSTEGAVTGGYLAELQAAKETGDLKAIEAVLRKHNISFT